MSNKTTTPSLTAQDIKENIINAKAHYVKCTYRTEKKPKASFKGTQLVKVTSGVFRSGIAYENLQEVKEGIASGERGEVQPLPYGEWDNYPYTIKHNDKIQYRMYPTNNKTHRPKSKYFVDGNLVSNEEFAGYLTPSAAEKMLNPTPTPCFNVKEENIIGTEEFEQYELFIEDVSENALVDVVIKQIQKDISDGDTTAITELLENLSVDELKAYLPEV